MNLLKRMFLKMHGVLSDGVKKNQPWLRPRFRRFTPLAEIGFLSGKICSPQGQPSRTVAYIRSIHLCLPRKSAESLSVEARKSA